MLRVDQNIRRIYNLANTLCFDIIRIDLLDVKESQLITRKTVEEKIMKIKVGGCFVQSCICVRYM